MKNTRKEHGFTLIELMIVVAIIGILAALALPKFAQLVEKSREAATKGNMNSVRSAVSIYYGDNEGIYPTYLECGSGYLFSRFMDKVPPVKATHAGVGNGTAESPSGTDVLYTNDEVCATKSSGWRYNSNTGRVFVNSSATDSKEMPYSTYGY
jgi:prepilin-type N-terminal cleavage/methylation domain-containing protein